METDDLEAALDTKEDQSRNQTHVYLKERNTSDSPYSL